MQIVKEIRDMLTGYQLDFKEEIQSNIGHKTIEFTFDLGNGWTIIANDESHFFMGGEHNGTMIACQELGVMMNKALIHLSNQIKRAIKKEKYKGLH